MHVETNGKAPAKNITGIAVVILLHVFIIYALLTGLAREVVEVIKKPVQAAIIEEIKPTPPPKLLPRPPVPTQARPHAPPPAFVPPPEVSTATLPPQNTIAAVSDVKPERPAVPASAPAPASSDRTGASHVSAMADTSHCGKPEYPASSLRKEEEGTVTLAFLIGIDGAVLDAKVEKSSGSPALDNAARVGLSLCKFTPATTDGKPEQSWTRMQYIWKLE